MTRSALPLLLACLVATAGCATVRRAGKPKPPDPIERVLAAASALLGERTITVDGRTFRSDCSGFVTGAFHAIGVDLVDPGTTGASGTELIYRSMKSSSRLRRDAQLKPGDLLIFHNTWDRNGNGLRDDRFTHVGLVEVVERDGRARFLHFGSGRVKRDYIHLGHPDVLRDPESGREWNSHLRRGAGKTLAGQLFFRSARPL